MKIAITGTHGTGKSFSTYRIAQQFKKEYPGKDVGVLCENVRLCPVPVEGTADLTGQMWIFTNQISREIEMMQSYDILICDRTVFDAIVYTSFLDKSLSKKMFDLAIKNVAPYHTIYFKSSHRNDYLINDGVRDTDPIFRQRVEDEMIDLFERLEKRIGLKVVYC